MLYLLTQKANALLPILNQQMLIDWTTVATLS